jgi:antitoxin (DNA-binding transcriptional repressor) of toxin-antitoxin stability system
LAVKQIDLDDLPPKVAHTLASLAEGEELTLVQHGAVVARLLAQPGAAASPTAEAAGELEPGERMKEVLDHFNAMIHDEF